MNRLIARIGLRAYRPCLKSIYSIDGNVTWRCGEIGIRYALMGKTGSSCMLVQIQPLPMKCCRLGFVGVVELEYTTDSKSVAERHEGSTPSTDTGD